MKRTIHFIPQIILMITIVTMVAIRPAVAVGQHDRTIEPIAPTLSTGIVAVTGTNGAQLRAAPDAPVLQILGVGELVTVTGRDATNNWLFLQRTDGSTGWARVDELVIFGRDRLPVTADHGQLVDGETVDGETVDGETVDGETVDGETVASAPVDGVTVASETVDSEPVDGGMMLAAQVGLVDSRLNIRSGPGTGYAIVDKALPAQAVTLSGRTNSGDWVQLQADDVTVAAGWVASRYLESTEDLMLLPVVDIEEREVVLVSVGGQSADGPTVENVSATALSTAPPAVTGSNGISGLRGTLAFQTSPGGPIYAYRLTTGKLWYLGNGFDPAISPNGQTVAFVREGGESGIYLIDIDGGNERLIFSGRTRLSSPKWSPDGQWILFTRSDEFTECVNVGRGGCVDANQLPPWVATDELALSKDYEYNLAVVDPNGNNYHDIAALESARVADWNEAGIVYQSSAGLQITADRADAENRLLLFIPLQPPHEDPDWQANGGTVAFVQHHGSHYEIFTINADGSGITPLTQPATTLVEEMPNNVAPAWSPDGEHLVFLSNREENGEAGTWRIWVMDADGGNQRALAIPLPAGISINYTYGNEQAVSWGP